MHKDVSDVSNAKSMSRRLRQGVTADARQGCCKLQCNAGDMTACLSASDVDGLVRPVVLFPSDTFFYFGERVPLITAKIGAIRAGQSGLAVLWVRHHWVAVEFKAVMGESSDDASIRLHVDVFDSARSTPVERTLLRQFAVLGILTKDVYFRASPQQIRGSDECGLFAALCVLLRAVGIAVPEVSGGLRTSLDKLRYSLNSVDFLKAGASLWCVPLTLKNTIHLQNQLEGSSDGRHNPYAKPLGGMVRSGFTAGLVADVNRLQVAGRQPSPVAVNNPRQQVSQAIEVHDVDAPPQDPAQDLLERTYSTQARVNEARREAQLGSMISTETVDELFLLVMAEALKDLTPSQQSVVRALKVGSAAAHQLTKCSSGFLVQPLCHSGHFVFLAAQFECSHCVAVRVFDSLPMHAPGERNRLVALITGWRGKIQVDNVGPQASNDCGFMVVRQFILYLEEHCGVKVTLPWQRKGIMPLIIHQREASLAAAHAALNNFCETASNVNGLEVSLTVNSAPDVKDVRATTSLSHGEVRRRLKANAVGTLLQVKWSRHDAAGTWVGRVARLPSNGLAGSVDYFAEECPTCGEHRDLEDWLDTPTPFPKTVYYVFDVLALAPSRFACICDDEADKIEVAEECAPNISSQDKINVVDHSIVSRAHLNFAEERQLPSQHVQLLPRHSKQPRADDAKLWHIWKTKPPFVSVIAWRQLAKSTRQAHIRWLLTLNALPISERNTPLGSAVVRHLLKLAHSRGWQWSTFSTALSACRSAVKSLPLYTSEDTGLDLCDNAEFSSTLRRAQQLARISCDPRLGINPLTHEKFKQLSRGTGLRDGTVRIFLRLAWFLAARVGDLRQVHANDLQFEQQGLNGSTGLIVTFRHGKGAAFHGPFSIFLLLDADLIKGLRDLQAQRGNDASMFTFNDQRILAAALKDVGCQLRSIRKGSLLHMAHCGVDDATLQVRSTHRSQNTLMRYLGWGASSSSIRQAAFDISRKCDDKIKRDDNIKGDDTITGRGPEEPARMGRFSGFSDSTGRRNQKPSHLFPLKAPTAKQLGIEHLMPGHQQDDPSQWPLLVKKVSTIDFKTIGMMAHEAGAAWVDRIDTARRWCETTEFYDSLPDAARKRYRADEVPFSKLSWQQVVTLMEGKKAEFFPSIEGSSAPILGYCKGWTLPQHRKRVLRPIFEPSLNWTLQAQQIPRLSYPHRLERRAYVRHRPFRAELDAAAYFDQFELAQECRRYFVIKVHGPDGSPVLLQLTRLPMGGRFSPFVAQSVTWLLVQPIVDLNIDVDIATMLDNVRLSAATKRDFDVAWALLLGRVRVFGITINPISEVTTELLCKPATFLGEQYHANTVANSPDNCLKLEVAWSKLQRSLTNPAEGLTFTNFASLIGLMLFLCHTIDLAPRNFFSIMRAFSSIARQGATQGWNLVVPYIAPSLVFSMQTVVTKLLENVPVQLPVIAPPSQHYEDYDIVIFVDASKSGYAAQVVQPSTMKSFVIRQSWKSKMVASASAEPKAVTSVINIIDRLLPGSQRLAIVTDHEAMVTGQRRPYSAYGGFSFGYFLNEAFCKAYDTVDGKARSAQFFHVVGSDNIMDSLSRDTSNPLEPEILSADASKLVTRGVLSLHGYFHPFLAAPTRDRHCV